MIIYKTSLNLFIVIIVCGVFVKIYQHNTIVALTYTLQRHAHQRALLEKEYSEKLVVLTQLLEPEKLLDYAQKEWGMKPLAMKQIVQLIPAEESVNFLGSTSQADILRKLGFADHASTATGGAYVGTRL